jgi:lipoyl(octanoyl) transferase
MALDFLLLQRHAHAGAARFRHYEWRSPAFTFGLSQKIDFIRTQLPAGIPIDLCRRPTGGGLVDHRDDWTYALIVPRGHPLEELRATQSYRIVHECLASALQAQGVPAVLKPLRAEPGEGDAGGPAGVCFQRAELYDVVHGKTAEKIAGAAQKRNKRGLLVQGSLWRPAGGAGSVDWDRFGGDFAAGIAAALEAEMLEAPWPDLDEDEVGGLVEHYSSPEWLDCR